MPGEPLTHLQRRAIEIAVQAATASGDQARADQLAAILNR
jgi:hypothetical protein